VFQAYAVCVFLIQIWSIYNVLRAVPSWALAMDTWTLVGTIAYTQAFALIESVVILALLVLLAFALPGKFYRDQFVAQSSVALVLAAGGAILAHYKGTELGIWNARGFMAWAGILLALIGLASLLVARFEKLRKGLEALADRMQVLATIYIAIGIISFVIVIIRNV
jgi:hypothetical protein